MSPGFSPNSNKSAKTAKARGDFSFNCALEQTLLSSSTLTTKAVHKPSISDFQILGVIGNGAFGKVYHVVRKDDGEEFALKTISK